MSEVLLPVALVLGVAVVLLVPMMRGNTAARGRRLAAGLDEEVPEDTNAAALREIEFDRSMGKLSEEDYQALRAKYATRAAAVAPAPSSVAGEGPATPRPHARRLLEEQAEALVQSARKATARCDTCGDRPEPDAIYCSTCGRRLGGCPSCGSAVREAGARFCSSCGAALAP